MRDPSIDDDAAIPLKHAYRALFHHALDRRLDDGLKVLIRIVTCVYEPLRSGRKHRIRERIGDTYMRLPLVVCR